MSPQRRAAADHDGGWSAEFQKQRRRSWRKSRWALVVLFVTFAAAWWDMRFFPVAFVGGIGAILWLVFVCIRHYLCPACGKTPMTNGPAFGRGSIWYDRKVDLDPEFCANCGVRVKPEPALKRLFF